MKVKCKINNLNSISQEFIRKRLDKYWGMDNGEIDLHLEREYIVYGIHFWNNYPNYFLFSEEEDDYPKPYDTVLFDVIDESFSSYWKLSFFEYENCEPITSFVFDEWANDPMFYERLLDGEPKEIAIFSRYRQLMDEEFLLKIPSKPEILIGVTGKIIKGSSTGWYVQIQNDQIQTGAYFIKKFPSRISENYPGFDDWVESYECLRKYFKEAGWKIEWK